MITISKDGTQIAYDKIGKGPALVLVDGAFCHRENGVTPRLVPLLSNHFTVFSYDRRGRGESTDTKPYSVEREIEDLEAIVGATMESPFVCGFSSGAALLVRSVAKGLPVNKIALFEPPYTAVNAADAPPEDAAARLLGLTDQGKRGEAVKYFMTKVMGMPAAIVFLFRLFGKSIWKKNEGVSHTLSYDIAVMGNFGVPKEIISKINVPTIVIGGEKSPKKLADAVNAAAQGIPGSKIILLKDQSHNVSMKVLAPVLIDFFK
ncbi:MAG TPA: alpha/beta hydrolase [Puia sp.]|nr:alpha/beta hydrolase [Puia sp.]